MSAPKFREGDVVRWLGDIQDPLRSRYEYRVQEVREGVVDTGIGGGLFGFDEVTLLRRPVRVGDLLSWSAEVNFNAPHVRHFTAREGHDRDHGLHKVATHYDGTPIEPPAAERIAPACRQCLAPTEWAREVTHNDGHVFCGIRCHDEYDRIVYGIDRRPTPEEVGRRLRQVDLLAECEIITGDEERRLKLAAVGAEIGETLGRIQQAHNDIDRQRANRLADECGQLRHERDELLRENAVLRRKLERLERRGKR